MLAPLQKGYITQIYKGSAHYGVDIGWTKLGIADPDITAWDDGIVIASYFMTGGGNTVVIRHEGVQWYQTRYVHLKSRSVVVGEKVLAGQKIGVGGSTGNSTGPHLHFEVLLIPTDYKSFAYGDRIKYAIDPLLVTFFSEVTGTGVQKMTENTDKLPLAIPKYDNVRIRSTPAILANNSVGHVPVGGLRYLGESVEVINGYKWAKLLFEGKVVYAALSLLDIKVNTVIKEVIKVVEKIVEVEKPLDITMIQDGVTVKIVKG
jgi:murein DD-endopeptidase MepM/ murein hydrolase activator NlpD